MGGDIFYNAFFTIFQGKGIGAHRKRNCDAVMRVASSPHIQSDRFVEERTSGLFELRPLDSSTHHTMRPTVECTEGEWSMGGQRQRAFGGDVGTLVELKRPRKFFFSAVAVSVCDFQDDDAGPGF